MAHALFMLAALTQPCRQAVPDSIDRFVQSFLQRMKIPSAAIAVAHHGRVVKAAGYGTANLELDAPATVHSAYEIGSVTKQFTAEAVMMLFEEGKLSLDDPIQRYLPEVPEAWSAVRLRHLLTHTSGLYDWEADTSFALYREYSIPQFVAYLAGHPLAFTPGSRFAYTNSAYPLLAAVVEQASGRPYEQFVTDRIFGPAGMTETRFRDNAVLLPNRAAGYAEVNGVVVNGQPIRPGILRANGGIVSTASDMARWSLALWGGKLLSAASMARMTAPTRLNDGSTVPVGIGWFLGEVQGHRMVVHNGSTVAGYSSVVYRFLDDDLDVVALLNLDRFDAVNRLALGVAGFYAAGLRSTAPRRD